MSGTRISVVLKVSALDTRCISRLLFPYISGDLAVPSAFKFPET